MDSTSGNKQKERAQELFKSNAVTQFEDVDPFNKGNRVAGWMCRSEGPHYGSLLIWTVNGEEAVQVIQATPKMGYPFDKNSRWQFPSAKIIRAYEKLDGTNILQYRYFNSSGFKFLTYKTRLLPFLRDGGRFGDFKTMWDRMLEKYPRIPELWEANQCNMSFELYGSANPHLILYSVPLDTAILFGISNEGKIKSPHELASCDVPTAPWITDIDKQYVETYQWQKAEMQSRIEVVVEGESYRGLEGQVWYMSLEDGRTVQYKCKPDEIESIHFSKGRRLSKTTVMTTCMNALENIDVLTYDFVVELLREEYPAELISLSKDMIFSCIQKVNRDLEFRLQVETLYKKIGVNILVDKRTVMRELSNHFTKTEMTKVYSAVMSYETVRGRQAV